MNNIFKTTLLFSLFPPHELAHVKNRDILISTIAATFAGALLLFSAHSRRKQ